MSDAPITLKVKDGKFKYPLTIRVVGGRLELNFPYNKAILAEVKAMQGAKWHGYDELEPKKVWSINNSARNRFQLAFLGGAPVYARYDAPLIEATCNRPEVMQHQHEMVRHVLTRKQCIFACEMGTGKTLAAIEAMELSGITNWWWVGPKSALYSVQLEFRKWKAKVTPRFMTYDELRKVVANLGSDDKLPQGLVGDESSRLKNPTAKRTMAFDDLAEKMRTKYGDNDTYVIEMSGTPSPKDPADWYAQCEIACPGYIREGNIHKFKNRLAVIVQKESYTGGGVYPHLVTWKDDEKKCNICGMLEGHVEHHPETGTHEWEPSINEVSYLYKRLMGLVLVKFKKDVLKDLPDKVYERIYLEPSEETKRLAKYIEDTAPSAIVGATLLRELSDGFQYKDEERGHKICPTCNGNKTVRRMVDLDNPYLPVDPQSLAAGHRINYDDFGAPVDQSSEPLRLEEQDMHCEQCNGVGQIHDVVRTVVRMPTPKEDALKELLDLHEEIGRFVVYGGFTGSIDTIVDIAKRSGWDYIRADGRGWESSQPGTPVELLSKFQENKEVDKMVFIGQPGAAGMGLNLTASPGICFYSNDFNAESRHQAEARIHRPGMNTALGATIYDLIHLDCDAAVLDNLNKKIVLQDMTMGVMRETIKAAREGRGKRVL